MRLHSKKNKVYWYLVLLIVSIPLIFWNTTQTLIDTWTNNTTYNHGFLIFPISLWLIYRQRQLIACTKIETEPHTLIGLILILILWFISYVINVNVTQQFAIVALIPLSVWILFGRKLLIKLAFPLAFLFFSIPFGHGLVPYLMEITADITVATVKLFGVPVYRDGLFFSLPTGRWSVVEACSGLNYFVASLTLGTLFSYLTYRSLSKRLIFIFFLTLFSIIANGLRAFGIVMIGHLSNMEYGTGDHSFYGWLFFGVVVLCAFFIGNIWADSSNAVSSQPPLNSGPPQFKSPRAILLVTILICMISVQVYAKVAFDIDKTNIRDIELSLPDNFGAWRNTPEVNLNWKPLISGASIKKTRSYRIDNDIVQLSMGYYPWQTQGSEAVNSENRIVARSGNSWKESDRTHLEIDEFGFTETEVYLHGNKILIWIWYLSGNWESPNANIAKIYDAINIILYKRSDAAFLTIATPIISNRLEARKKLKAFHSAAHAELLEILSSINSANQ